MFEYTDPVRSETGTFGNCVGEDSYYRIWRPDGPSRAGLLLVHGLGEHSGRYEHVAEFLTQKGVTVYALDQLGHDEMLPWDLLPWRSWLRAIGGAHSVMWRDGELLGMSDPRKDGGAAGL